MSTPSPYILTVIFTARITLICLCLVDSSLSMPFISIRYGFSQPSLESIEHVIPFYPFSMNAIIMLPLLPTIRPFVFSYDATHSLGTHSFGIKIDAIPGRFNFTSYPVFAYSLHLTALRFTVYVFFDLFIILFDSHFLKYDSPCLKYLYLQL